ncbi:MAG: RNA polymerase sigma factor [Rubricoccaceae bacterium]
MSQQLKRIDELAAALPFDAHDVQAANEAFGRWCETQDEADRYPVELWAYWYVNRYFVLRFAAERTAGPSDLDAIVTRVFGRLQNALPRISDARKFASYVSVACKNALRNYRRDRRPTDEIFDDTATTVQEAANGHDRTLVRRTIEHGLARLPVGVAEVARLRFLDDMAYEEIAAYTGRPVASVRAYASKALARLREMPEIQQLYVDDLMDEPR